MKFLYEYRTSDNVRHDGIIHAPNREAVFDALKSQGIRPSHVREAPGIINKLLGKGKRWVVIVILTIIATLSVYYARKTKEAAQETLSWVDQRTRRQPIGDSAIIEMGIKTGWADVFSDEGERFLASFAIPGVPAGLRNTSEAEIRKCLTRQITPKPEDSIEVQQIKAMVEGMKDELRQFLADNGTIVEYGQRLVARQEQELGYYNRAKSEIETIKNSGASDKAIIDLWETRNTSLRRMGIRLLSIPD